jgi:hypothetical protein
MINNNNNEQVIFELEKHEFQDINLAFLLLKNKFFVIFCPFLLCSLRRLAVNIQNSLPTIHTMARTGPQHNQYSLATPKKRPRTLDISEGSIVPPFKKQKHTDTP